MSSTELVSAIQKQLDNITECAICLQVYTDPRLLPCAHTFCLRCIEQYTTVKEPRNAVLCPQCNQPFTVPGEGVVGLKKNYFAAKIVELKLEETLRQCNVEEEGVTGELAQVDKDAAELDTSAETPVKAKMNVLLIGPSGVGKSTFINSFLIYLKYDSLEVAQNDPNFTFEIPVRLKIRDPETNKWRILTVDGDDNENFEKYGESVTQQPRVYEISHNGVMIRLIDTPGVGDTRGKEVDEQNINQILKVISHYDELHAICMLLRSGETRMSEGFKYCFKKLLANLHEKAQDNILFCMTYANVSKFEPGETVALVEEFLDDNKITRLKVSEDTLYFVDNEVVEYMMKFKFNVRQSDKARESVIHSWQSSVDQIKRLVNCITRPDSSPYEVRTTKSMLFAKQIFKQLAEPLALIVSRGTANIMEIEKRRQQLEELQASVPDNSISYLNLFFALISYSRITRYELEVRGSEKRNMYCISQKCTKVVDNRIEYPICHEDCNCFSKRTCASISWRWGGACNKCGCSYRDHDRKTHEAHFEAKTDEKEFEAQLEEVKKSGNVQDAIAMFNRRILRMREVEMQMSEEQNMINDTCAKFSAFLQQSAILAEEQNTDFVRKYMDLEIIKLHMKLSDQGKAPGSLEIRTLKALTLTRKAYDQQVNEFIKEGQNLDLSTVNDMAEKLYSLPFYGKTIKKAVNDIKAASIKPRKGDSSIVSVVATAVGAIGHWLYGSE